MGNVASYIPWRSQRRSRCYIPRPGPADGSDARERDAPAAAPSRLRAASYAGGPAHSANCSDGSAGARPGGPATWAVGRAGAVRGACRAWRDLIYGRRDGMWGLRRRYGGGRRRWTGLQTHRHRRAGHAAGVIRVRNAIPGRPHGASSAMVTERRNGVEPTLDPARLSRQGWEGEVRRFDSSAVLRNRGKTASQSRLSSSPCPLGTRLSALGSSLVARPHAVGTDTFSSLAACTIWPQVSSSMKMPFLRRPASILASGSPG